MALRREGTNKGKGRPSPWRHRPTCTIRIPQDFEAILMEVARNLDQCNEEMLVIDLKSLSVNRQVKKEKVNLVKLTVYKHSAGKVIKIKDLVEALQIHIDGL